MCKYRVKIVRSQDSVKHVVADFVDIYNVNRHSVPTALNVWINRHGISVGDKLEVSIVELESSDE